MSRTQALLMITQVAFKGEMLTSKNKAAIYDYSPPPSTKYTATITNPTIHLS